MIRIKKVTIIAETEIPGEHLETLRHATAEHYGTHPDNVYLTYEDLSEKHDQNNNQFKNKNNDSKSYTVA